MANAGEIRPDLVDAARSGEVLARIVAHKRQDVAARMEQTPLATFASRLERSERSLVEALRRPGVRFILECKRASPSKGLIRPDFDPIAIAGAYAPFADAISVLTDGPYFGGSFDILETVRAHVPAPVLCKDFVIDPYQVFEARRHGADAILLMLSVLDDTTARACLETARQLAVDCLVEVHDEAELDRALALDANVIGINNRNLKTLRTELAVTERLAGRVPPDRLVVSESGVYTRQDVDRLAPFADAFLVGTSLMAQPDLAAAVRQLCFGRVKICGLRNLDAAQAARRAGATFGGLIFVERSPRYVDLETARALAGAVNLHWVGVFADSDVARVVHYARALNLTVVQLHGREDRAYVDALRGALGETVAIWKAVGVDVDAERSEPPALPDPVGDRTLFDARSHGQTGGTGRVFPWEVLRGAPQLQAAVLAGGLGPANVVAARQIGPWALDVNSGVEVSEGVKSETRIHELFTALRGSCRSDNAGDVDPAATTGPD
ncbi:MAG: bifunctional indole-3-glycerol-phosphate synthase TrpC/phosphoribosylanthranilate isomerase TrpF [Myxococcales bacterium FL481]|nr:MAG: bifunctional indole-3-glycerol-phosphate synthase TrpC/phosphoribosylanthranilate isomerase TrpF [Myxococcales bacterium FL481]